MPGEFVCYFIKLRGLFMSKVYWNAWSKTMRAVHILTQIVLFTTRVYNSRSWTFFSNLVVFIEGEFLKHCFSYYRRPGIVPNHVVVLPIPLASIGALVHLHLFYLVSKKRKETLKNVFTLVHTVRKSRNITGQNMSPILWYVALKM